MDILLLGAQGQLGWELGASLSPLGRVLHYGRKQADLTQLDRLERLIRQTRPQVIVNAAAHTEVDQAESEPQLARLVNAEAPALLARLAREVSAWLVHYSTDYVFDGRKDGWYTEDDPPAPLNVYGHTKLEGDEAIMSSGCRHLIFRISWVFSAHNRNFPRAILELAHKQDSFSVTADQYGCPTGVELLSSATALALNQALTSGKNLSGLYNLASSGDTNWHGYAVYLIKRARQIGWNLAASPENIHPAPAAESGRAAQRPANSRLSTAKFTAAFGLTPPPWQYYVDRLLWTWTSLKALETPPPNPGGKIMKFTPPKPGPARPQP
ncbi:NAD(P)-dependent oxidoreductase [Deltaproteobacteria bacterium]|nr:NAD(P)-dependent oxidoreductase [Deltaproteobacteria bacterium]GHV56437.1 NAD(P)-dependent oxidoreductase [Deltaproteobacteria bacterium]